MKKLVLTLVCALTIALPAGLQGMDTKAKTEENFGKLCAQLPVLGGDSQELLCVVFSFLNYKDLGCVILSCKLLSDVAKWVVARRYGRPPKELTEFFALLRERHNNMVESGTNKTITMMWMSIFAVAKVKMAALSPPRLQAL